MIVAPFVALLAATPASNATPATPATHVDIAVRADPVVFALAGWSIGADVAPHVRRDLDALGAVRVRASIAAFHVVVPEVLLPLVAAPAQDLRVVEDAVQLGLRFPLYDLDGGGGWWFGPEVYLYRLTYVRTSTGFSADARECYAHLSVGWRWFPLRDAAAKDDARDAGAPFLQRLFLEPWATLGLPVFGTGDANVGGVLVRDRGLNWHATVSVGAHVL